MVMYYILKYLREISLQSIELNIFKWVRGGYLPVTSFVEVEPSDLRGCRVGHHSRLGSVFLVLL